MSTYLIEAKIPEKRMLKSTKKKIPLKNQDIVDCFNILNQDKKLLKKGNFYLKRKNEKKDLPYVEENELYSIVDPKEALNRGNLYDYYFWPYKYVANVKPNNERDALMTNIQIYSFKLIY